VAEEMRIDGAVEYREAQLRGENVFHLLPDLCGIGGGVGCVFHVVFLERKGGGSFGILRKLRDNRVEHTTKRTGAASRGGDLARRAKIKLRKLGGDGSPRRGRWCSEAAPGNGR
jgi:hypothetical protein